MSTRRSGPILKRFLVVTINVDFQFYLDSPKSQINLRGFDSLYNI